MIKLFHVDKYFNRKKKNEIHVINDTSLQIDGKGLVAFLGPNGSGKTTLLSAIGGLADVDSGDIFIDGEKLTTRMPGSIDEIRTLKVGYIFQNYELLDNVTVYDNVAIALRMTGVRDSREIEEKVRYVLEKTGMYRYRNRNADSLSGGERQRVGIARALVKNPAIVIADEPTGNLDSRNSIEIMNIIKEISREKLVLLVTHEESLATFYATRIIRIKDGQVISDEVNEDGEDLDYRNENRIYLKDIEDHRRLKHEGYDLDFYNDDGGQLGLDIVIKNGNVYIRTKDPASRLHIVSDDTGIELIDDHYREITRAEQAAAESFDLEKLETKEPKKYRSIMNLGEMLARGFRTVGEYNILKKILLAGFFITAVFITYSMSNIFGVLHVSDDEFILKDRSYITVEEKKINEETYREFSKDENYRYILPGSSVVSLNIPYDDYFQTKDTGAVIKGSLSDADLLKKKELVLGELPEEPHEVVVDRMVLKKTIDEAESRMAGYGRTGDFLGKLIDVPNVGNLKIVGISDNDSPCIYTDKDLFINIIANTPESEEFSGGYVDSSVQEDELKSMNSIIDYELRTPDVALEKGKWPKKPYEAVVNEKNKGDMKIGKTISQKVNGQRLKVTGYYSDAADSDFILVENSTVEAKLISEKSDITICPEDRDSAIEGLRGSDINIKDDYADAKSQYLKERWSSVVSALIMSLVILVISFIEIFLIIRASFLSRGREIGVLRAIGVRKGDIYAMFIGEIIAITTMASLPAFIVTSYVLYRMSVLSYFGGMFVMNPAVMIVSLVLIYGFNMIFGLIPVMRTIRKSPADLLKSTDRK